MKSVLITGTSSGIGLATAAEFGRAGYRVFATMRNLERGRELQRITREGQLPIIISELDVDSEVSVKKAFAEIKALGAEIDILVNNAGVDRYGSVEETSLDSFRSAMETNYFGALRCIQAVVPQMRARRSGTIVNVSSIASQIACSPIAAYSATKAALEAVSEALAQEMRPYGVRVAVVQPGIIDTPMSREIGQAGKDSIYAQCRRFSSMFRVALRNPVGPDFAARAIREIAEGDDKKLRYPVGPDAMPFINWRKSLNDEDWVAWGALDDEDWFDRVKTDFGLELREEAAAHSTAGI